MSVTGFNRDTKDIIIYGFNGYENRDKQHDYGAELEAGYVVTNHLTIKVNYAYVDGKITQKVSGKDTTFHNLIRRPKHNVHFFAGYKVNKNLFISSSLQITGKRTDNNFMTFPATQVDLKAYALWNLYADYNFLKKLSFFVDAKNLILCGCKKLDQQKELL